MRTPGRVEGIGRAPQERLQPARALAAFLDEGHTHVPWTGLHRDPCLQPRVHGIARKRGILHSRREVGVATDAGHVHALAVQQDLELVLALEAAHRLDVAAKELRLNQVLAVERERVADQHAAVRPERQPFDVLVLRQVMARAIDLGARTHFRVPHRQRADAIGRGEIAIEQRRRHGEHVADVVEAVAGVVGRQQGRHVHVEREHIADGVRILRPVQAAQDRAPGIRRVGGTAIERALEVSDERGQHGLIGPARALRRHRPRAEFADHAFPQFRVLGHVRRVARVEGHAARLGPGVVAGDAVGVEEFAVVRRGRGPDSRSRRFLNTGRGILGGETRQMAGRQHTPDGSSDDERPCSHAPPCPLAGASLPRVRAPLAVAGIVAGDGPSCQDSFRRRFPPFHGP